MEDFISSPLTLRFMVTDCMIRSVYAVGLVILMYIWKTMAKAYSHGYIDLKHEAKQMLCWVLYTLICGPIVGVTLFLGFNFFMRVGVWGILIFLLPVIRFILVHIAGNITAIIIAIFSMYQAECFWDTLCFAVFIRRKTRWARIKGFIIGLVLAHALFTLFGC